MVAFLIAGTALTSAQAACTESEFTCVSDQECISLDWVCDDFPDCNDRSDEEPEIDCSTFDPGAASSSAGSSSSSSSSGGSSFNANTDDDDDASSPVEETPDAPEASSGLSQEDTSEEEEEPEILPEKCSLSKCRSRGKMKFLDGRTYHYKYQTQTTTQVVGSSPKNTTISMEAALALNVLTACEMELVVSGITILTSKSDGQGAMEKVNDPAFTAALTKNPLRFSYQDGVVEEVCPASDEDPRALNFKRAVISLLQNSMPRLDLDHHTVETDIVGECEVDYSVLGAEGILLLLEKTRNIATCRGRSSTTSFMQGVPYSFDGGLQTLPLLNTTSKCVQSIGEGMIKSASCLEHHRFTPFSSEKGGILTTVSQNLTFTYHKSSVAKMGAIHGRTDLKYDHHNHIHVEGLDAKTMDDSQQWRARSNQILDQIAENKKVEGVATSAPRLFKELVQSLRHLDFAQLWAISEERAWGPERGVFDDALPMVGTGASVGVMRDLMEGGKVNDIMTNTWLTSLSFIPRPDLDTIEMAAPLLETEAVPADAFLGVGALVHSYCRDHPACSSEPPVQRVMGALHGFLEESCYRESSDDKIQILMALKGLENAGLAVGETIPPTLNQCIQSEANENEIRLAAISAFRRFPCGVSREPVRHVFLDPAMDSELRIAAYLELMRCIDYATVQLVKHVLLHEEVNQVGSFVWTHLLNMKESGLPSRAEVQGLLSNQEIASKFSADVRKFSRNFEWSGFYDDLNIGAGVDANIIFSQHSYIPRSATFNFTTDLFGHSLNLLEFGARAEGWDRYTDSIYRNFQESDQQNINNPKIRNMIATSGKREEYFGKAAELSLHMKTFGNEIYYRHLHGMEKIMEAFSALSPIERIMRLNKGEAINMQKSWLASESAFIIPTTAGVPLNLTLTASIALDVHASGNLDIFSFAQTGQASISGQLKPSVGVEVVGSMLVDGHAAQSGAQLVTTLHSSTVVDGRFDIGGSEFVRVDIKMPREKVEIMNFTSNLVLVHGSVEAGSEGSKEILEGVANDREELADCSGYDQQIGAKLCWSLQYPNASRVPESPFYPLTGPSKLQVVLHKIDPTLTSYQMRYTWERRPHYRTFLVSLNTPGTATSREHSIRYNINFRSQNVFLDLNSPRANLSARGRYVWTDTDQRMDLSVSVDNRETATVAAGFTRYRKSGSNVVTPIFTVTWKEQELVKVSGTIDLREKLGARLYEVDMQVAYLLQNRRGNWEPGTGTIKGSLSDNGFERNANLQVDYVPSVRAPVEIITIEYRVANSSTVLDSKFERRWRFFFSQFPNINFKGEWFFKRHFGSMENTLQVNLGENFENPQYRVDIFQLFTFYHLDSRTTFNSTFNVKHQKSNLDFKMGADWFHDEYVLSTGFVVQYATNKEVVSQLHLRKEPTGFLNAEGYWFLRVPDWTSVEVKGDVKELRNKIYQFDGEVRYGPNWVLEVGGRYGDLSTRLESLHDLLLDVTLPGRGLTQINATFHANERKMSVVTHVLLNRTHKYGVKASYIHGEDDLRVREHSVNLELYLPGRQYKLHSEISIGTVITVVNDIHLDRHRDIHMRVTADILQPRQRGLKALLKWDANRDPNQKLDIEVRYETPSDRQVTILLDSVLSFLGQQYRANWRTNKLLQYIDRDMIWEHKNEGSLSWMEPNRRVQEIATNFTIRFRRGDTAELYGKVDITTPFIHWKQNYLEVKYARDMDHIESSLRSRWHDGEFLDLQLLAKKTIDASTFRIETKLDVSSSFEGLVSASTGIRLEKTPGIIDTNIYIQWDTDRLELALEGKDDSYYDQLRYSVFGQVLTTIEGYRDMSTALDLAILPSAIDTHAKAKWEGHEYKLRLTGEAYSGLDYLRGNLTVTSLQHEDFVKANIRVYHDPLDVEEKLSLVVMWPGQEARVEGQVATLPQHFKAGIQVDTTFEEIRRAVIVLGHSKEEHIKTEARVKWNDKVDAGFVVLGQVTSLSDFLVSCTILTPFPGYEVITGEVRNLFTLDPEVRVNPRIYGQIGERKYGLGASYEQGQLPRLRIAFELYTPLPELHTVVLDLCDNTTSSEVKYDLTMKYGPTKQVRLSLETEMKGNGLQGQAKAVLPLQSLDERLSDATLEAVGSIFWEPAAEVNLTFSSQTDVTTKLSVMGSFPRVDAGELQVAMDTPVEGYENLDFMCEYSLPTVDEEGHFNGRLSTTKGGVFQFQARGTTRNLSGSFSSPFEPFRTGSFMWKLTALDVVKSHLAANFGWGEKDIKLDATIKFQDQFIQMFDGTLETPWEDLERSALRLEGKAQQGGYRNQLVLEGAGRVYQGTLFWKYQSDDEWDVNVEVSRQSGSQESRYTLQTGLTNTRRQPFKLTFHVTTPHQGFQEVKFNVELRRRIPYKLILGWGTTVGSGNLEMTFRKLSFSEIEGTLSLTMPQDQGPDRFYTLELQLTNGFTQDTIDVTCAVDFKSNQEYWDHLVVKGIVRQVTYDPGELSLYLLWPGADPISFTAIGEHYDDFQVIKPTITLDLTRSRYSFAGEMRKKGSELNLTGTLDWKRGSSDPQKVVLHSGFVFSDNAMDGKVTLDLPMVKGWNKNQADIHYETREGRHWFTVNMETGPEVTSIKGNMLANGFPAGDGEITVSSTLKWDKQPLTLNFKQELTMDGYEGDYHLEWPSKHNSTSPWERNPVHASLKHNFLESGHQGALQVTGSFTMGKPVQISYEFKFPSSGDVRVVMGVSYGVLAMSVKADRVTVVLSDGILKQRTSFEFDNFLWPFGISSTKETKQKSDTERERVTTLELYDLQNDDSRISVSFAHNSAQSGRHFSVKGNALGREIVLAAGYVLTSRNFSMDFLLSWSEQERIEFNIVWEDMSRGFTKEHKLKGKFSQPYRTVLLDGSYKRSRKNIDAFVKFNWDGDSPSGEEEILGRLQWADESVSPSKLHKAFVSFSHPLLEEDIKLSAELRQNLRELLAFIMKLQYSPEEHHDVIGELFVTRDTTHEGAALFSTKASLGHQASQLELRTNGSLTLGGGKYALLQNFLYTNITGHDQTAKLLAALDRMQKTVHASLETWKKLVDIHVEVEEDPNGRWTVVATGVPNQKVPLMTHLEMSSAHPVVTITFDNLLSNDTVYDTSFPRYIAEQVVLEGGVEDLRHARFSMRHRNPRWLTEGEVPRPTWETDADFSFKLNHSRLLSSHLVWRTELAEEVMSEVGELIGASYDLRLSVEDWLKVSAQKAGEEALKRAEPILQDVAAVVKPLIVDFKNESREFLDDLWLLYSNINKTTMELRYQQSLTFIFNKVMDTLENVTAFRNLRQRLEGGALSGQVKTLVEKIRNIYEHLFHSDPSGPGLMSKLKSLFSTFAQMYDQFAKRLYLRASQAVQGFTDRVGEWLRRKWQAVYDNYKPHILRTFDNVETQAWIFAENLMDWLQKVGLEIKSSAYYQKIAEIVTYVEGIYKDFTEKSKRENLEKYYTMFVEKMKSGFKMLVDGVAPFVQDWIDELQTAWAKLLQYNQIARIKDAVLAAIDKVVWTVRYVDIRGHLIDAAAFILEHGDTIVSQTSIQASQKHIVAKTKFLFTPSQGKVLLVQKLPVDWQAFNVKPNWRDLPEYKNIQWVRDTFFSTSNTTILDKFYKYWNLNFNPVTWVPPFPATGYMIGEQHFMTFDGHHLEFKGRCQHLLVADMVSGQYAVTVNYHSHSSRTIIIYIGGSEIELATDFRVTVDKQPTELPVRVDGATVDRWLHKIEVRTDHGLRINWNLAHDVLSISLSGTSFDKTGGLLGVYNNEPMDDQQLPDGTQTDVAHVLAQGWDVSRGACQSGGNLAVGASKVSVDTCQHLFQSKTSPFKHCFFQVDPTPYLHMCMVDYRSEDRDTCTAATAYMEACSRNNIPVKIPVFCVECVYETDDGETHTLEEGTSTMLEVDDILKSTDVVLLVEDGACNKGFASKKPLNRFESFINAMDEELAKNGLRNVRYAMVLYGGESLYAQPAIATVDNQIFTDASNIHRALDRVEFTAETDSEDYWGADAFEAFNFAADLTFRAGVSVTFVLFPCRSCKPSIPSMDYSTMYHILLEYSITLHVFNDELFDIPKATERSKLYGMDRDNAYTVKDSKRSFTGDQALRRQLTTPKDDLGYCAPLALETGGSIFTMSPIKQSKKRLKKQIEKVAIVFGRRVSLTAKPQSRKRCVCVPSTADGAASVQCDNWDSGQLSILAMYGNLTDMQPDFEMNMDEVGTCQRRDSQGVCVQRIES